MVGLIVIMIRILFGVLSITDLISKTQIVNDTILIFKEKIDIAYVNVWSFLLVPDFFDCSNLLFCFRQKWLSSAFVEAHNIIFCTLSMLWPISQLFIGRYASWSARALIEISIATFLWFVTFAKSEFCKSLLITM